METQTNGFSGDDVARLRLAVARLARRLRQESGIELTPSQLSAVAELDRSGPLTLGELATAERIRPPTMTKIVAGLVQNGYVTRSQDPSDGRICRVALTTRATLAIKKTREARSAYLASRLGQLRVHDRDAIAKALPAIERLLEDGQS